MNQETFKIVQRSLTYTEAKLLVSEIKATPNITGYSINEWLNFKNILVAEVNNQELIGICYNNEFSDNWVKIDVLYVMPEFRNQGIGGKLFYESITLSNKKSKNVYTVTRNPIVINLMKKCDFLIFENIFNLPYPYKQYQCDFNFHNIKWFINFYRIKEMIRKKIIYKSVEPFLYGIKPYIGT
jgi:GNAT superfamily N-acetyltransferase